MALSFLPRELLHVILDKLPGESCLNLLCSGDALLWTKLRSLRRLKITLGRNSDYLHFMSLHNLLSRFSGLKSLELTGFDDQQVWKKKLKPSRLPSSLEHLSLDFYSAVQAHLEDPKLFRSLSSLTSLSLREQKPFGVHEQRSKLSFKYVPPTLQSLSIESSMNYIPHTELNSLPSSFQAFKSTVVVEIEDFRRNPLFLDFQRFTCLHTLHLSVGHFIELQLDKLPSTITDLNLQGHNDWVKIPIDFNWSSNFPNLKSLHWLSSPPQFQWKWLLQLPSTVESISASFAPWKFVSERDRCDIIITLNSNNANRDFGRGNAFLIPSKVRILEVGDSPLPQALITIFTGLEEITLAFKEREWEKNPATRILYQTTFNDLFDLSRLKKLSFSAWHPECFQIPVDRGSGEKRKFPSSMTALYWTSTDPVPLSFVNALPPTLEKIHGLVIGPLDPSGLKRFERLKALYLHPECEYSTSTLVRILPQSLEILDAHNLRVDSILPLPNLTSLSVKVSAVPLTWLPTLPASLTSLDIKLGERIDVSNPVHREALLAFPRNIRSLSMIPTPELIEEADKRQSEAEQSKQAKASRQALENEECQMLELITRNLRLISLKIHSTTDKGPFRPFWPAETSDYFAMHVPFFKLLIRRDPVTYAFQGVHTLNEDHLERVVSSMSRSNISTLSVDSMQTRERFYAIYFNKRGIVKAPTMQEYRRVKLALQAEPKLHWFLMTLCFTVAIASYGIHWYFGRQTMLSRLWNGGNIASDFTGLLSHPSRIISLLGNLYLDLNFISALLTLPVSIQRMKREKFQNWSRRCPSPLSRYPGIIFFTIASGLSFANNPFTGWYYAPTVAFGELMKIPCLLYLTFPGVV